jgi:gluconokinase
VLVRNLPLRDIMVIVVMGVAGSGKTTVGSRLAQRLGWPFIDADDLHAPEHVEHMRRGGALTDDQRVPWLDGLARLVADSIRQRRSLVLACSALSRAHRGRLLSRVRPGDDVRVVHLHTDPAVIRARLAARTGHFFPHTLLDAQLAALEVPGPDVTVPLLSIDAAAAVDDIVASVRREFRI